MMEVVVVPLVHRFTRQLAAKIALMTKLLPGPQLLRSALELAHKDGINTTGLFLNGADLSGLDLEGWDFSSCDLSGVNFDRANLTKANLSNCVISGISLKGTVFSDTIWSEGILINKVPILIYGLPFQVIILDEHMQCGCERHTLREWKDFSDRRVSEMVGLAGIRAWKHCREALLAIASSGGRDF